MIESYDISKTFKTTQTQLTKIKEIERILRMDQSRAIRYLIDVGYAGVTAVRSPGVISTKDDVGLWKIPLFEELSLEAREATYAIWEKELGWRVDSIRRANENFMKQREKDYETTLRTRPIHRYGWGTGDMVGIPLRTAEEMLKTTEMNVEVLKTYVGMKKEYELRHKKRLPIYGFQLSKHASDRLLIECLRYPGHDVLVPSIVSIAKNQKAKASTGATV